MMFAYLFYPLTVIFFILSIKRKISIFIKQKFYIFSFNLYKCVCY